MYDKQLNLNPDFTGLIILTIYIYIYVCVYTVYVYTVLFYLFCDVFNYLELKFRRVKFRKIFKHCSETGRKSNSAFIVQNAFVTYFVSSY